MALQTKTFSWGSYAYHSESNAYVVELTLTEESTSNANNTSSVSYVLKLLSGSQNRFQCDVTSTLQLNGVTVASKTENKFLDYNSSWTLLSGTAVVTHNNDGSLNMPIVVSIDASNSNPYAPPDTTLSWNWELTNIPRASAITSASNITLGNNCSITWTPNSSDFKYKIKFSIDSWSYTTDFISPKTVNSYTYTGYAISGTTSANGTTIYAILSNTTSGTMTATLTTYNANNVAIGSSSQKTFTVNVPTSVVPTIGAILLDPNDINSRNMLVKSKNGLTFSVSGCSAGSGSSIKYYTFSGPSISTTVKTSSSSASAYTSYVSNIGTLTYTVTVVDQRGRSASKSQTITCYDYYTPYFSAFNAYRANSDGSANINGTYLRCTYTPVYASVNGTNSITVTVYYNNVARACSGGSTLINLSGDTGTAYDVYFTIIDSYGGSQSTSVISVFGESRILNITSDGTGVAIGKMASNSQLFECRWPAEFNGGLTAGISTTSSAPTDGIKIHDVRYASITPDSFGDSNANFYFDQIDDSRWYSVLHMKGWRGSYSAWELAGNAHNSSRDDTLKYRQGLGGTWGDWQSVITNKNIIDYIYPVGSIYMSVNNTSPQTLFGGTWERIQDRFLLAAGSAYAAGDTGGAATVSLTAAQNGPHTHTASTSESGSHTHKVWGWLSTGKTGSYNTAEVYSERPKSDADIQVDSAGNHTHTVTVNSSGSGAAHENMPPYLTVYMWKRTG